MQDPIFCIFVNNDLKMSKGQVAAQCSHVTQIVVDDIIRKKYESCGSDPECVLYEQWKITPTTLIFQANQQQMDEFASMPNARHFRDTINRVPPNSLTTVAFISVSHKDFNSLRLY